MIEIMNLARRTIIAAIKHRRKRFLLNFISFFTFEKYDLWAAIAEEIKKAIRKQFLRVPHKQQVEEEELNELFWSRNNPLSAKKNISQLRQQQANRNVSKSFKICGFCICIRLWNSSWLADFIKCENIVINIWKFYSWKYFNRSTLN